MSLLLITLHFLTSLLLLIAGSACGDYLWYPFGCYNLGVAVFIIVLYLRGRD